MYDFFNYNKIYQLTYEFSSSHKPQCVLTEPHIIVLALAMFQFGLDHRIFVAVRRSLQREALDLPLQWINHLPSDKENDIH